MMKKLPIWISCILFCASPLQGEGKAPPQTHVSFKKITLLNRYVSEGASVGDINADGKPDIVAGSLWWQGPDFKKSFAYAPVRFFPIEGPGLSGYANNFFTFPTHITNDKWMDIIKVGLPGQAAEWAKNPGEKPYNTKNKRHACAHCKAQENVCNESPQLLDVIGDSKPELLAFSRNHITLAIPHPDQSKPWQVLAISPKSGRFQKYTHGLGAADIDGDGLKDILEKAGWWQQPKNWDRKTPWKFHPYAFAPKQGGAQMFAYDIDGDGDNDVVTALNAHAYGLAWYEQIQQDGKITFKRHDVMTDQPRGSPYGVCFSQPHAMGCADIDGDGVKDVVTGKCYYAHNGKDPGAKDPAVLYWFRTVRHQNGSVELVPYQIDDDSGVGRQITVTDLNGDGKNDIVVGNKKGVFVFLQTVRVEGEERLNQSLKPKTFRVHGPHIKHGVYQGRDFIGWWPKNAITTVPFSVKKAKHKGKKTGFDYHIQADVAAAPHAGGVLKIALSSSENPKARALKSWTVDIKPTKSWGDYKRIDLGGMTLKKTGKYYLHFIPKRPNDEFINLSTVAIKSRPFPAFRIVPGRVASQGGSLKKGNNLDLEAQDAEDQKEDFVLAPGFTIELVSSEELGAVKPISLAFDDAGRLWTQTAREYPGDNNHQLFKKGGRDQILVFDTPYKRGPQKPRVFAEGLAMPVSVLPYDRGVYAIHGPDILYFEDTNKDGKADKREILMSGFGIQDTHTTAHQLTRSPGGWITLSQGCNSFGTVTMSDGKKVPFNRALIGRFRPNGTDLQVIGAGMNNIWCWAVNNEGRTYIHEANDFGLSHVPFERDATYASFLNTLRYPDSIKHPPTAEGLGLGGTGFSGIAISENIRGGFPKPWKGVHFVANPITGCINTVSYTVDRQGVHHFKKERDLLRSEDLMFRPVAIAFGPDGCLYVIDWYNRIISHNEVAVDHPARDKVSGRIWRIRHQSQKNYTAPNVEQAPDAELLNHLVSGNTWEMRSAWHQVVFRQCRGLIPQIKKIIASARTSDGVRVHALWCLEGLGEFDKAIWESLLKSQNQHVRYEAVRSLSTLQPEIAVAHQLLEILKKEKSYYVLNEIIRFYRDTPQQLGAKHLEFVRQFKTPKSKLPNKKVKGWGGPFLALGGSYEKVFLNLLVDKVENRGSAPAPVVDEARWNRFIAEHPQRSKEDQGKVDQQIQRLVGVYNQAKRGDLQKGKAHFQARCAGCHSTAPGGKGFAPALNGGEARSAEALLTAIIDPNAAAEAVFNSYKVIKKDGSVIEGFRSDLGSTHVTLSFMGGGKIRVPLKDIKEAGYVRGKSVMIEGMISGMSDEDVIDLIQYIQSVK